MADIDFPVLPRTILGVRGVVLLFFGPYKVVRPAPRAMLIVLGRYMLRKYSNAIGKILIFVSGREMRLDSRTEMWKFGTIYRGLGTHIRDGIYLSIWARYIENHQCLWSEI